MAAPKKVQVQDQASDDFGAVGRLVEQRRAGAAYRYQRGPLWWLIAAILYHLIAPLPAWVVARIYGMRFVNRSRIRKTGGCYFYGNHTHWTDAIIPYLLGFPKRAYVITGPIAISVPVVRHLVPMMGGVPLNPTEEGKANFRRALDRAVKRGKPVAVLPEAHEWPYYNGIRDFPPYSFTYPVRSAAPVIPYVVTYRQRRWRKHRPPLLTITVGEPILPEAWQGEADPKRYLRDAVHKFMTDTVREMKSFAWIEYELESPASP